MASPRSFRILVLSACVCLGLGICSSALLAAGSAGAIRGTVTGPDGKPMGGVPLLLRNDITGFRAVATSDTSSGAFSFYNVPFNPYELHVEVQGFQTQHLSVDVHSSVPVQVNVAMALETVQASVKVEAEKSPAVLETDSSQSHVDIDKSTIDRAPAPIPSRGMEAIVVQSPGFAQDENGRYHFQGAHSQQSYVVDGQPISDQIGITFSNSIDPGILQGAEVIYGNVPAEYGEKIAAVIALTTKSGLGTGKLNGEVHGGGASFRTYDTGASLGGGSDRFGAYVSANTTGSDRFLDPVNFDNLHNDGRAQRLFLRLDSASPSLSDSFRLSGLLGQADREVPNTFSQQATDTNNKVYTTDWNANFGWQHIFDPSTVLDVTAFARNNRYEYRGSDRDPSVIAESKRSLDNYGVQPVLTIQAGAANELKFGAVFKSYPIAERFSFGITDPNLNDPASPDYNPSLAPFDLTRGGTFFQFAGSRTVTYLAAFAQDTVRLGSLTAQIGVRYDHNDFPISEGALQPRIGVAYYIEATKTVLRASYNRIFETPEYENILFSSSQAAADLAPPAVKDSRALGGGLLLVPSERQNVYEIGAQQALGSIVRMDVNFWWRKSSGAGDQDQFENTGIVFPLAFASGDLHGWNVRLDMTPVGGLRGYASIGHVRAIYVPPFAGGLFLDAGAIDAINSGPFVIDHDQNLSIQGGASYDLWKTGAWVAGTVRYDSGLVTGADIPTLQADPDNSFAIPYIVAGPNTNLDPNRIKARTIFSFSLGVDLSKYGVPVSLQGDVLNAFNTAGLYNILSTFGGTHVIPPRTYAGRVRVSF
jgi:hypothetical protein